MQVPVSLALFVMLAALLGALLAVHQVHKPDKPGAATGGSASPTHQTPAP